MTVGEICYGRGTPMSLHELCVGWRAYFHEKARLRQREQDQQQKQETMQRSAL